MVRRCPECGSYNVRRSSFRDQREDAVLGIFSPYRCRDCRVLFRVVSKKVIIFGGVLLAVAIIWALLWLFGVVVIDTGHRAMESFLKK